MKYTYSNILNLATIFAKKAQVLELGESTGPSGLEAEVMNLQKQRELSRLAPYVGTELLKGLEVIDEAILVNFPHDNLERAAEILKDGRVPDKETMQAAVQEFQAGLDSIQSLFHLRGQLEQFL